MKALTLHQPWATLVALGEKTIETRSWGTNYRGPLAIHAAKHEPLSYAPFANDTFRDALEAVCSINEFGAPNISELPKGGIVCVVELMDCVMMSVPPYWDPFGWAVDPKEHEFGHFAYGRYAWMLSRRLVFPDPIPATGRQRLWNLTPALALEMADARCELA